MENLKSNNLNNENINIKSVLCIIGIMLILLVSGRIYLINKNDKTYEENGWKVAEAICTSEKMSIKNNGEDSIKYYKRTYLYTVAKKQYTLNVEEVNSTPSDYVRYDSINPNIAEVYRKLNVSDMVILIIGVLCLFFSFILKFINFKELTKIKEKILKISKWNTSKMVDVCFWGYLAISFVALLIEMFMEINDTPNLLQYTKLEILLESFTFIITRCTFKKLTHYIDICSF